MTNAAPKSLCLIRLSALGDVCHAVALVKALQSAWPTTEITWIIGQREAPLVKYLDNIRFIVFDKKHNLSSFRRIRSQLSDVCFDVMVLAQTSFRANVLSLGVRAKRRVGFAGAHAKEGHGFFVNETIPLPEKMHQAEAIFAFAPHLLNQPSLKLGDVDRSLPIDPSARSFAIEHQPNIREAVLISPCSSHPKRNWTAARYAAVADWVVSNTQRPVILMGGPSDRERAMGEAIVSRMHQPILNLIGQDTLHQALAMLERAYCLITPDSGPAHMADGLGTPVIGLYAATRPERSGPWASQALCVNRYADACLKYRHQNETELPWSCRIEVEGVMELIEPKDVIAKLKALPSWSKAH